MIAITITLVTIFFALASISPLLVTEETRDIVVVGQ